MNSDGIIKNLPKALVGWYDFKEGARVLFVSGGKAECDALCDVLAEKGLETVRADADRLQEIKGSFDYIVAAGIIERSVEPARMLAVLRGLLGASGKLLIGAENRLALRAFCGDQDPFSGHVLDGIEGYARVSDERKQKMGGRLYSKAELKKMLDGAGFGHYRFYSVIPDIVRPQMLLAEGYIPNERLAVRTFPQYENPATLYLDEGQLYDTLLENDIFHQMADGFLIECAIDGELSDASQITLQGDRDRRGAMATVVKYPEWVAKRPLYPEGRHKIDALGEYAAYLRRRGVPLVDGEVRDGAYVVPYIDGVLATTYFQETLRRDRQEFMREFGKFRDIILRSSEHVPYEEVDWERFEPGWERRKKDDPNIGKWRRLAFGTEKERADIGVILKRGYIDLVSLNCFYTEGGFIFFDQEFFVENFPANAILFRTVDLIYGSAPGLEKIYPVEQLLEDFGMRGHMDTWRALGTNFIQDLRNDVALAEYHRQRRIDWKAVAANRHRMDYSQEEYDRLFTDIFKGYENKKIYLFGSGRYAERFIRQFGGDFDIAGIIDNNAGKWGEMMKGTEIPILPPSVLAQTQAQMPLKVFICIMEFDGVLRQLKGMGIRDIAVYSPSIEYVRPRKVVYRKEEGSEPKEYHVGYVAGVFDLFHIGHLNILRRAKEHCDYLIAGVVSDEQVIQNKKTRPHIPFDERLAIVQACRYVDEAVRIPPDRTDTEDAYYMYHFDAQFSGSDYEDDPVWLAKRVFLRQHGSDMVFFPYTENVSSTDIKERVASTRLK